MYRILSYFICALFCGCYSPAKYASQQIISSTYDNRGKLLAKQFSQLISWPSGDRQALITEHYDTAGRVIKEYGYNHPAYHGKQYLTETSYLDGKRHVINIFLWNSVDSSAFFSDYRKAFDRELIYFDSAGFNKNIQIMLQSKDEDRFVGYYDETFPYSQTHATVKSFTFELKWQNVAFDSNRKLILDSIKILKR